MPVSESYLEFIKEQLEAIGRIRSRRMFGGAGIYCDDLFFALISNNTLYFKVDDSNRDDFTEAGMGPFQPYKDQGNDSAMQYYQVPADVLESPPELEEWALKAVEVARNAAKKKKPRRK